MRKKANASASSSSSVVAAAAARAAAAAKAVASTKPAAAPKAGAGSVAASSSEAAPIAATAKGKRAEAASSPVPPLKGLSKASCSSAVTSGDAACSNGPVMFSMSVGDDDDAEDIGEPIPFNTLPLDEVASGADSQEPEPLDDDLLQEEEQREYQMIEENFKAFKARQCEVEKTVADLLGRLNATIRVPSSVASSECGENLTSRASSEWDTESLGPTEDGMSMLGSPLGSPREHQGPLQRVAAATVAAGEEWPTKAADWKTTAISSSVGKLAAEKGDGTPKRPSPQASQSQFGPSEKQQELQQRQSQGMTPRLTSELLAKQQRTPLQPDDLPSSSASGWTPAVGSSSPALPSRSQPMSLSTPPPQPKQSETGVRPDTAEAAPKTVPGHLWTSPPPTPAKTLPPANAGAASSSVSPVPMLGTPAATAAAISTLGTSALLCSPVEDEDLRRWQGWTVVATPEGRIFFHNELRQLSQWHQPVELQDVLGEWEQIEDESSSSTGQREVYFRNELLQISLWKDPRHTTNIFQAALDGNIFFMQLYAEVEGQLNVLDSKGRCALHYACAGGATQSVLLLLHRQAEVDPRDNVAETPLIFACRYGFAPVVKVLLDFQADFNAASTNGSTALHEAASMGQLDCVHLLLLYGADAGLVNENGDAPVDVAVKKRHLSCVTLFRRHVQNLPSAIGGGGLQGSQPLPGSARHGSSGSSATPPPHPPLAGALGAYCGGSSGTTVLEVPTSSSGETDPFGASSSSELAHRGAAGSPWPSAATPAGYEPAEGAAAAGSSPRRGRRRRQAGSRPRVEYVGGSSSDSELDAVAEAHMPGDGSDAPSSSESSGPSHRGSPRSGHSRKRGTSRRREKSPVGLGISGRMQWLPRWLGSIRSAFAGPVRADLGEESRFVYNKETQRWELDGEDGRSGYR